MLAVYNILKGYVYEFEMLEISGKTVSGASFFQAFAMSPLFHPCIRDVVIGCIHPVPFLNFTISTYGEGSAGGAPDVTRRHGQVLPVRV